VNTAGTSGQVLTSAGAGAPTWATPTTGTVTSVSGTGTVNGITLTGTVTSSGSLTLGGTLSGVSLTTQVSGTLPVANGGTNAGAFTAGSVVFAGASGTYTQNNAAFFWDNTNSRLGIGTTTTANKITASVSSAGAAAGIISLVNPNDTAGTAADLDFNCHSSGTLATGRIRGLIGGASDYPMSFWTYDSSLAERMRLTNAGNLLLGTTTTLFSGSVRLEIKAPASNHATIAIVETSGFVPYIAWNQATTCDNNFMAFGTEAAYTGRGSISYNRTAGLVSYNTTSDYRAKEVFGPIETSGATIDSLKVYTGKMLGATQSRPMLVAHEAQAVAPYAVTGEKDAVNEDGTPHYQQMDVSALVPLLIAEVQSLRARVAQLEGK
jgi:hypothetical protein